MTSSDVLDSCFNVQLVRATDLLLVGGAIVAPVLALLVIKARFCFPHHRKLALVAYGFGWLPLAWLMNSDGVAVPLHEESFLASLNELLNAIFIVIQFLITFTKLYDFALSNHKLTLEKVRTLFLVLTLALSFREPSPELCDFMTIARFWRNVAAAGRSMILKVNPS